MDSNRNPVKHDGDIMAMHRVTIAVLILLLGLSLAAHAADRRAGEQIAKQGTGPKVIACVACHGVDGGGNAGSAYPRLAGFPAAYLAKQLRDFATDQRINTVMQPVAKALTPQQIADVSEYFSSLPPAADAVSVEGTQRGAKLVLQGDWSKTIPACVQCHGPGARGAGPNFPPLAGQNPRYLEAQIKAWKDGKRKNDPNGLMRIIAERLSDEQAASAAAYLGNLKPSPPRTPGGAS